MIHIAGNYSEECKVLSDFGNKWFAIQTLKNRKHNNNNAVK